MRSPSLLYTFENNNVLEHAELKMCACSGGYNFIPYENELVCFPDSAFLTYIPNSFAVGFNMDEGCLVQAKGAAVNAVIPDYYLRTLLPSFISNADYDYSEVYTAVGWMDGFVIAAFKADDIMMKSSVAVLDEKYAFNNPSIDSIFNFISGCDIVNIKSPYFSNIIIAIKEKFPDITINSYFYNVHSDSITINMDDLPEQFDKNIYSVLDLFVMPGLTDVKSHVEKIINIVNTYNINFVKLANMPGICSSETAEEVLGIKNMLRAIKKEKKDILFGVYYRKKSNFFVDTRLPDLSLPKFKKGSK